MVDDVDAECGTETRSHDGHMVRVVGGVICMYKFGESFSALNS